MAGGAVSMREIIADGWGLREAEGWIAFEAL
jgi:hypothetical protein